MCQATRKCRRRTSPGSSVTEAETTPAGLRTRDLWGSHSGLPVSAKLPHQGMLDLLASHSVQVVTVTPSPSCTPAKCVPMVFWRMSSKLSVLVNRMPAQSSPVQGVCSRPEVKSQGTSLRPPKPTRFSQDSARETSATAAPGLVTVKSRKATGSEEFRTSRGIRGEWAWRLTVTGRPSSSKISSARGYRPR